MTEKFKRFLFLRAKDQRKKREVGRVAMSEERTKKKKGSKKEGRERDDPVLGGSRRAETFLRRRVSFRGSRPPSR